MFQEHDIVYSKRQPNSGIFYVVLSVNEHEAKCTNIGDRYNYTIPVEDLVLWIRLVRVNSKLES